jgi:RNA polymerase sigma-70 factor (ECF subfamily)
VLIRPIIGEFFEENYLAFKRYLKGKFRELNDYDIEDIIQHTIMKLLYKDDDFLSINNLTAYMYKSLQNSAKDYFKKYNRVELYDNDNEHFEITSQTVEERVLQLELKTVIKEAIISLDVKSRYVFVETEIMGRSYDSLVKESGEKLGTLLSRKSRAKKQLRDALVTYIGGVSNEKV